MFMLVSACDYFNLASTWLPRMPRRKAKENLVGAVEVIIIIMIIIIIIMIIIIMIIIIMIMIIIIIIKILQLKNYKA